jgi:hypothetical protein
MSSSFSARSFLRRAFSDSSSLRRYDSLVLIAPWWFLQRRKVASRMPSSLATSGTVAPAASLASAWRSLRTICFGECRLPIKSPPYAHPGPLDSHSNWTRFQGAGQSFDQEVCQMLRGTWAASSSGGVWRHATKDDRSTTGRSIGGREFRRLAGVLRTLRLPCIGAATMKGAVSRHPFT